MYVVMKTLTMIILIILLLLTVSFWMKVNNMNKEKKSIFECGFDPSHEKRNSFSLRFFLMTIIFLLFDLEITFILPLPIEMKSMSMTKTLITHYFIAMFFVLGTYLEWKQGALSWMWLDI